MYAHNTSAVNLQQQMVLEEICATGELRSRYRQVPRKAVKAWWSYFHEETFASTPSVEASIPSLEASISCHHCSVGDRNKQRRESNS